MSKSLLVEYIPFKPIGKINEDMGAQFGVPGGLVVQGVLQRAGAKNQNGKVYPKNILNRKNYKIVYQISHWSGKKICNVCAIWK